MDYERKYYERKYENEDSNDIFIVSFSLVCLISILILIYKLVQTPVPIPVPITTNVSTNNRGLTEIPVLTQYLTTAGNVLIPIPTATINQM
jgi:hypothetical protein